MKFILHFFKNWKKVPQFSEKNILIVVIYGINFSFKIQFLEVSRRNNWEFLPMVAFFLVPYMIPYQSALIPRKLPCPEKFQIARLRITHKRVQF